LPLEARFGVFWFCVIIVPGLWENLFWHSCGWGSKLLFHSDQLLLFEAKLLLKCCFCGSHSRVRSLILNTAIGINWSRLLMDSERWIGLTMLSLFIKAIISCSNPCSLALKVMRLED
jgi:hypothetical protein